MQNDIPTEDRALIQEQVDRLMPLIKEHHSAVDEAGEMLFQKTATTVEVFFARHPRLPFSRHFTNRYELRYMPRGDVEGHIVTVVQLFKHHTPQGQAQVRTSTVDDKNRCINCGQVHKKSRI